MTSRIPQLKPGCLLAMAGAILLQGCALPRSVVIHDGLQTTVVDARTRAPLADAIVFARRDGAGQPIILSRSDQAGRLELEPRSEWKMIPFMGEALVSIMLWVCREGYAPAEIVTRRGWNADLRPAQIHAQEWVALDRLAVGQVGSCGARD